MKNKIHVLLKTTLEDCFERGTLKKGSLPEYVVEVPNNPDHGHFATNLPLTLASSQRRAPPEVVTRSRS